MYSILYGVQGVAGKNDEVWDIEEYTWDSITNIFSTPDYNFGHTICNTPLRHFLFQTNLFYENLNRVTIEGGGAITVRSEIMDNRG